MTWPLLTGPNLDRHAWQGAPNRGGHRALPSVAHRSVPRPRARASRSACCDSGSPVARASLSVWLINLTKSGAMHPEYVLYELGTAYTGFDGAVLGGRRLVG